VRVIEAGPGETGGGVGGAEIGREVVRGPALAFGAGDVPAGWRWRGDVAVEESAHGPADGGGESPLRARAILLVQVELIESISSDFLSAGGYGIIATPKCD
jgi:hypothetical protein